MKHVLSDRIRNLTVSQTLEMSRKAREMREKGFDVLNLSLGEPDFNTPDFIKDAAIQAINDNYHAYPPVNGYLDLRETVCKKFKRDNGLEYTPDQIVISTGAKQSLANIIWSLINPGDEIILPSPYWVSYVALGKLSKAEIISLPTGIDSDYKITAEQLEKAITPRTKLFFLNSPANPSGSVYLREELEALAEVLRRHPQVYIISDEIYEHIRYDGVQHTSFAALDGMYERTITVNGVSKAFSMTGWRIGYIGAPLEIARACTKMQGQVTSGANCIGQRAALTALEASPDKIQYMVEEFDARRKLVSELLKDIPGFKVNDPKGAFYFFPDVSHYFGKVIKGREIKDANDLAFFLLEEALVATVSGDAFGSPECLRLSYASSRETLVEAIKRIKNALTES